MDEAIVYAKRKIRSFPDLYRAYAENLDLFKMLVEDCRKQLEAEQMSLTYIKLIGGMKREQNII
ncbi:hypothetical protein QTL86_19135 [Cellulosilyticum sp. ST5]|uniref:hypothetical protein n=1 Tax=Cellulosilyticum sp. ST5 TaxID=3055805 RepID=UPI0039775263